MKLLTMCGRMSIDVFALHLIGLILKVFYTCNKILLTNRNESIELDISHTNATECPTKQFLNVKTRIITAKEMDQSSHYCI